jgi:ferric iron reductase protein FhuF
MELMESRWTDDRMDDLKHQVEGIGRSVDKGFAELRDELRAHRRDMDGRFKKVDERFEKVDAKIDAKFDALQDQIARTHETIIGLYAMLSRFSLWFAGAMAVTFVSVLLTLWLR